MDPAPSSTVTFIDVQRHRVERIASELGQGFRADVRRTKSKTCGAPCDFDDDHDLMAAHGLSPATRFVVIERRYGGNLRTVVLYDRKRRRRQVTLHFRSRSVHVEIASTVARYIRELPQVEHEMTSGEPMYELPSMLWDTPELCESRRRHVTYRPGSPGFEHCLGDRVELPPAVAPGRCSFTAGTSIPWSWPLLLLLAMRRRVRRRPVLSTTRRIDTWYSTTSADREKRFSGPMVRRANPTEFIVSLDTPWFGRRPKFFPAVKNKRWTCVNFVDDERRHPMDELLIADADLHGRESRGTAPCAADWRDEGGTAALDPQRNVERGHVVVARVFAGRQVHERLGLGDELRRRWCSCSRCLAASLDRNFGEPQRCAATRRRHGGTRCLASLRPWEPATDHDLRRSCLPTWLDDSTRGGQSRQLGLTGSENGRGGTGRLRLSRGHRAYVHLLCRMSLDQRPRPTSRQ
jgi:hypothetical protein